ncbi:hypothetical protein [Sinorhizobium mexicanum]|uniref:hypothetical protein n=1 Tax=Sinorhizobium mexicanum TaxID=375549 RepID=UPI001E096B71|nr:hypothetical protein [Sinorhizobium mexicanum]MBP1885536.1 hypothetical protein [Sinorhizobium mexicanum]
MAQLKPFGQLCGALDIQFRTQSIDSDEVDVPVKCSAAGEHQPRFVAGRQSHTCPPRRVQRLDNTPRLVDNRGNGSIDIRDLLNLTTRPMPYRRHGIEIKIVIAHKAANTAVSGHSRRKPAVLIDDKPAIKIEVKPLVIFRRREKQRRCGTRKSELRLIDEGFAAICIEIDAASITGIQNEYEAARQTIDMIFDQEVDITGLIEFGIDFMFSRDDLLRFGIDCHAEKQTDAAIRPIEDRDHLQFLEHIHADAGQLIANSHRQGRVIVARDPELSLEI